MLNPLQSSPAVLLALLLTTAGASQAGAAEGGSPSTPSGAAVPQAAPTTPADPPLLSFSKLLERTSRGPRLSAEAKRLAGKRVRMQGYMARVETLVAGGFYLCPRPLLVDESGAGSGELPPNSVFVLVRGEADHEIPFTPRLLSVTGRLEFGREEKQGRVTWIRLLLDQPKDLQPTPAASAPAAPPAGSGAAPNS